jgi:hypothetical protein
MPGGIMQLISTGVHDVYLIGCPQITYFKKVYKKCTHFAIEAIEQEINGDADFNKYFSAIINRDADLLMKLLLEMQFNILLSNITSIQGTIVTNSNTYNGTFSLNDGTLEFVGLVVNNNGSPVTGSNLLSTLGITANYLLSSGILNNNYPRINTRLIDYIELTIGGQLIDKLYGEWIDIWLQLSSNYEKWNLLENMNSCSVIASSGFGITYLPIPFWFAKNAGLALPMIALQYHEVKCNIQFKKNLFTNLASVNVSLDYADEYNSQTITSITLNNLPIQLMIDDCRLYGDYVYLDTDERRMFANLNQEYLIEQLQWSNRMNLVSGLNVNEINFNHPVKELIWYYQLPSNDNTFNYYDNTGNDILIDFKIEFNGIERFKTRQAQYFRLVQPYYHHSGAYLQDAAKEEGGFYIYSFAVNPESYQPSGSCNFSRINNAVFLSNVKTACNMGIYAINYNVLRIMNGMGGLSYGN